MGERERERGGGFGGRGHAERQSGRGGVAGWGAERKKHERERGR